MKIPKRDFAKGLPTDFGAVGKLLDEAVSDLPNKFDNFLNAIEDGFKNFFSPPSL